jgi:hypothetical protein
MIAAFNCVTYCWYRIIRLLRNNVIANGSRWTNNNCESENNVLKHKVQWRPKFLPNLIKKIKDLVENQFLEADRALVGIGNLTLRPSNARHRMTIDDWESMSACQRQHASDACFRLATKTNVSTSTDVSLTVNYNPHGSQKLNVR